MSSEFTGVAWTKDFGCQSFVSRVEGVADRTPALKCDKVIVRYKREEQREKDKGGESRTWEDYFPYVVCMSWQGRIIYKAFKRH